MSITQTSCPECGEPVTAGEPCPHCGTDVVGTNEFTLETGEEYTFAVAGEEFGLEVGDVELTVRIHSQWANLVSRTVFTAEVVACVAAEESEEGAVSAEDIEPGWLLVEELKETADEFGEWNHGGEGSVPIRSPIATKKVGESPVLLYRNDRGISLAELVALAGRELTVRQVADVFSAVLDGLRQIHESARLHLMLSPELIRVQPVGTQEGVPLGSGTEREGRASSSGADAESSEADEEDEGRERESEWGSEKYDETRPQAPLGIRLSDFDSDELSSLAAETSGLGDETSAVDESGIASDEHWIRELGVTSSEPADEEREGDGTFSDSRRDADRRPEAGVGVELEAVFEATDGLYGREEVPEDLESIPGFSPPESYSRSGSDLSAVSDVFSAGMLLYYLVSGRRPPASVYTRHGPALPARNFRPEFPPGLGPVIKRATRPDPEMRYPDVASMQTAFENALEAIEDRTPEKRETLPNVDQAVDRHAGIAKRKRNPVNQDDVFEGSSEDGQFALVVVADGVSTASYGSGEIASSILVRVAEDVWEEILPAYLMEEGVDEVETVEYILEEANARIVEYVNERYTPFTGSAHEVMGTTALVALYHEGTVTLGSVGDSRGYLQRGPGLEQLTIDHNLWSLSILEGVPADDALSMPRGDALARCLGTFIVEEGHLEPVPPGYDVFQFPVTGGDTLLMTTDGLVDFAGANVISAEENILATLLAEPDPALACLELILLANRGGGGDNIGLGIVRFE